MYHVIFTPWFFLILLFVTNNVSNKMIFHGINFAKIFKLKYLLEIFRHVENIQNKKKNKKKRLTFIFM